MNSIIQVAVLYRIGHSLCIWEWRSMCTISEWLFHATISERVLCSQKANSEQLFQKSTKGNVHSFSNIKGPLVAQN